MSQITRVSGLAAVIGLAMGGGALAGSPAPAPADPVVAPPPAVAPVMGRDWTGFYGGARLGWGNLGRDVDGDGAIGGLHLGYLQDFGGFALGVEGGYDAARISATAEDGSDVGRLNEVWRLGARAGVTTGDIFAYGVAGAARARIGGVGSENGWYGGVGLEYAFDDNWRIGGEILHHRFSDFAGSGLGVSANTLQGRVSFRF